MSNFTALMSLLVILVLLICITILLIMLYRKENNNIGENTNPELQLIGKHLGSIHRELGEIMALADSVDYLKSVLSNVKNRGIMGEIQLGNIISDIMAPSQYCENIAVEPNSGNRVEFAIKMPGRNNQVLLPIDSKFPADMYASYMAANEQGSKEEIDKAGAALDRAIKKSAKDIANKYIVPPFTTDFAIMFIPFEGLYIHVIERGLLEILQKEYKVVIAGPGTMSALLNSLQLGFKTLSVEEKAGYAFQVLNEVSREFEKFEEVLDRHMTRLNQANKELEQLIGVRTRAINKALDKIKNKID